MVRPCIGVYERGTRAIARWLATGVCLILCLSLGSAPQTQAQPGESEAPTDPVALACAAGDYARAASLMADLLAQKRADPAARPYQIRETERRLEELRLAAALPESAQAHLAEADRLDAEYRKAMWASDGRRCEQVSRQALEIRRALLPVGHPTLADLLHNLAVALYWQGRTEEAEPYMRESAEMDRALFGEQHPEYADYLTDRANLLSNLGRPSEAESLYVRGLGLYRTMGSEDANEYAQDLIDYALFLLERGRVAQAEPLARKALLVRRALYGEDSRSFVTAVLELRNIHAWKGDQKLWVETSREVLARCRALRLADLEVDALNGVGIAIWLSGDPSAGEPYLREALALAKGMYGRTAAHTTAPMHNLAGCLLDLGRYAEAESLYKESLARMIEREGPSGQTIPIALAYHGFLLEAQSRFVEEQELYEDVLNRLRRSPDPRPYYVAQSLMRLGFAHLGQGHYAEAESLLSLGAAKYEELRQGFDVGVRRTVLSLPTPYPALAVARLARHRTEEAWNAAELDLARVLVDLLVKSGAPLSSMEATLDSLESASLQLNRKIEVLTAASDSDRTGSVREQLTSLHDRKLQMDASLADHRARISEQFAAGDARVIGLSGIQFVLGEREAILGWIDVESPKTDLGSWGYVIRKKGSVHWAKLRPESSRDVESFRAALAAQPGLLDEDPTDLAKKVWKARIEPLRDALEGVLSVVVIPSGAMCGFPVEALQDESGSYLDERFSVSYAPSASVYASLASRSRKGSDPARGPALLVGDPPFSESQLDYTGTDRGDDPSADGPDAEILRGALEGDREALAKLPRLRSSREEIRAIAGATGGGTILLGPDASEQRLVEMASSRALESFETIHLATHALIDDRRPEQSALVLSQVGLPDPVRDALSGDRVYDGLLRAEEVAREWRIRADLVTLSACESGLGRKMGGEGYLGLAHAFLQAGARSLLVSLWKVDDQATALLMGQFYRNRNEASGRALSKAAALQSARRWLRSYRDPDGNHPYRHPHYWAAFVLLGDSGRIQ